MKKFLASLFIACLAVVAYGQALPYVPPISAMYYSTDGTGGSGTWVPYTSTGGTTSIPYVPPATALYYSSDGTGNAGTWVPWTGTGGGGGGASFAFPGLVCSTSATASTVCTPTQIIAGEGLATISAALGSLNIFGDSIMGGTSAANSFIPSEYNLSVPGLLQTSAFHPDGVNASFNGLNCDQVEHNEWLYLTATNLNGTVQKNILECGINNGVNFNNGTTASAAMLAEMNSTVIAMIAHASLPAANQFAASTCTQTTGTWASNNAFNWHSSFGGTSEQIAQSGAVLTCPVTTTVANQKIGFYWGGVNASSGGQFGVTLDAAAQTAGCSGTAVYYAYGCNSSDGNALYAQEFTVATAGTHTFVFTTTNATAVNIGGTYLIPAVSTNLNYVFFSGNPVSPAATPAAQATAITAYTNQIQTTVGNSKTNGHQVYFADLRNGTVGPAGLTAPIINNTTDYSPPTGQCYNNSGLPNFHPDCIGEVKWANGIIASAPTGIFFPGEARVLPTDYPILGNTAANWYTQMVNGFVIYNIGAAAYPTYQGWSSYSGPLGGGYYTFGSSGTHGPGFFLDSNGGSTFHGMEGSFYDTTAAQNYGEGLISSNGWLFENCTATATGDGNCTKEVEVTSAGGLILANGRKGTFVCTAAGTIPVANTLQKAASDVLITLNTVGGTISTAPVIKTVTAGTGFSVLCGAADTSTYNYMLMN